jgi:periplasmic mercuric ion binding protein
MNIVKKISIVLFIAFTTSSFAAEKLSKDTTVCFRVAMDCMSCKQKIEKNIAFEKGVKALDVNKKHFGESKESH